MPAELVDSHAHLYDGDFDRDRSEVIRRSVEAGVTRIVNVAVDLDSSHLILGHAQQFPETFPTAGIHPNYVADAEPGDFELIRELCHRPTVVAVGETGLDRYRKNTPWEAQVASFRQHIALAREADKPIIIHCRDCAEELAALLRADVERYGPLRGVVHSFCETPAWGMVFLELGLHLSFSGMLTYKKNAAGILEAAKITPEDRLLVETDCPYLAPVPLRGKRCEPSFTIHTAEVVANIRGCTYEQVAQTTTQNAQRLFGLP